MTDLAPPGGRRSCARSGRELDETTEGRRLETPPTAAFARTPVCVCGRSSTRTGIRRACGDEDEGRDQLVALVRRARPAVPLTKARAIVSTARAQADAT